MTVPIGPIDDTPPLSTTPITGQKGTLPIAAVDIPDDHNQVRVDLDGATMKLLSASTLQVQCDIELSYDGGKTWQFWAGCVFDGGWQGTYFRSRVIPDGIGRQTRATLTVLKGTLDTTAAVASANVPTLAPQDFGHHSVGIDATSDGGGSGGVSSLSWSHTLGASLTNSLLVVSGTTGSAGGTQFASVEWDFGGANQPLALPDASFRKADGSSNCKAEIWSVKAPSPSGTKTIKVVSVATCELCAGATSFYFVDQSGNGWRGGVGTGANGTVSSGTPQPSTGAITSNTNDKVVAVAVSNENSSNDTLVAGGGQTIFAHKEIGAGHSSHASSYASGASTVTMTFTGVGDTNLWAIVGGSVQWDGTGGAGGGVVPKPTMLGRSMRRRSRIDLTGRMRQRRGLVARALFSQNNISLVPGTGILTVTGFAPTVSISNNQNVLPGTGAATLTGFAPTVSASNNQNVTPGTGVVTLTGFSPSVLAGAGAAPGTGVLTLTGFAPTVAVSNNQNVVPGVGSLIATGFAPTIATPRNVVPGVGVLLVTGFAPTVVAQSMPDVLIADANALARRAFYKPGPPRDF